MPDKEIICFDCNEPFIFKEGEQEVFELKGYVDPKTCKPCKKKQKELVVKEENRVDISRECLDCNENFIITPQEQRFFASKLDQNGDPLKLPKRCKPCRADRRKKRNNSYEHSNSKN